MPRGNDELTRKLVTEVRHTDTWRCVQEVKSTKLAFHTGEGTCNIRTCRFTKVSSSATPLCFFTKANPSTSHTAGPYLKHDTETWLKPNICWVHFRLNSPQNSNPFWPPCGHPSAVMHLTAAISRSLNPERTACWKCLRVPGKVATEVSQRGISKEIPKHTYMLLAE